jgi:hypothetical protein
MSDEEKRKIKADALLERQEASEHLGLLEAKMAARNRLHHKLAQFSGRQRSQEKNLHAVIRAARLDLQSLQEEIAEACDIDGLLALDDELVAANERLEQAERLLAAIIPQLRR